MGTVWIKMLNGPKRSNWQKGRNFLPVCEACMAKFWPVLGLKGRTLDSSGFPTDREGPNFCICSTQLQGPSLDYQHSTLANNRVMITCCLNLNKFYHLRGSLSLMMFTCVVHTCSCYSCVSSRIQIFQRSLLSERTCTFVFIFQSNVSVKGYAY